MYRRELPLRFQCALQAQFLSSQCSPQPTPKNDLYRAVLRQHLRGTYRNSNHILIVAARWMRSMRPALICLLARRFFGSRVVAARAHGVPFAHEIRSDSQPVRTGSYPSERFDGYVAPAAEDTGALLPSCFAPFATTTRASSGSGRCKALASTHGARIQTPISETPL